MMMVSWVVSSIRQPAGSHYSETREEKTEKEEKQNFATPGISETQEGIVRGYNMVRRGNENIPEPFSPQIMWDYYQGS